MNSIHERALRVTYQDCKSTFLELLQKDNSVTIHQVLASEICKANKFFFNLKRLPIAYAHREITLYTEMLKLPTTVFNQSNI